MNTNNTTTGAGNTTTAHCTIEWAGGFCEKFQGTVAQAHDKVLREGLHEEYGDGSNVDDCSYNDYTEIMEYRRGIDGVCWHFVARIYAA